MPFLGCSSSNLDDLADAFLQKNWSIIPLRGDSDLHRPKAPALSTWRTFQQSRPSRDDVKRWFGRQNYSQDPSTHGIFENRAIGIVLGRVSQLAVLDIDDPDRAQDFEQQLPHLTDTLTIISGNRGLPHFYYQVPDDLTIPARMNGGVELRSDGQYVVAPGSVIGGRSWRVLHDVEPRVLNQDDLEAILRFMQVDRPTPAENPQNRKISPFRAILSQMAAELAIDTLSHRPEAANLLDRYDKLADRIGRNNALFFVTCSARDSGLSIDDAQQLFVKPHVAKVARSGHAPETSTQRMLEALATIASVYKRMPRSQVDDKPQLPNAVRERLLGDGLVNVARLLDALLMLKLDIKRSYTASQIHELVSPLGIGRNVVYEVLKTQVDGKPLFKKSKNPPQTPPSNYAYAASNNSLTQKTCCFVRVAKPGKKVGRPGNWFMIPAVEEVCDVLEVADCGSDRLGINDLKSPTAYRAGLHAAMLRRAPGKYSRRWLAERIGVSEDSCRRYEKRRGIYVQPTFKTQQVTAQQIEQILPEDRAAGQFLEDDRGKRYPALPAVARMLLAYGRRVVFRQQQVNHYSALPPVDSNKRRSGRQESTESTKAQSELKAPWSGKRFGRKRGSTVADATRAVEIRSVATKWSAEEKMLRPTTFSFAHPGKKKCCGPQQLCFDVVKHSVPRVANGAIQTTDSDDTSGVSERVYNQLRAINPARALTRKTIGGLIEQYGERLVEHGMKTISQRGNIRNPAGFLLRFLEAEGGVKACHNKQQQPTPQQKQNNGRGGLCCGPQQSAQSESAMIDAGLAALEAQHQQWLEKLKNSPYAAVYAAELASV